MENLLFVLALAGILVGAFSLCLPGLRRRGVSLPFMRIVDDEDDDIDIDEDLDQPLNKAVAPSKEKQADGEKKRRGSVIIPQRFVASPGAEMSPLPSTRSAGRPGPETEVDEENPDIVFEKPNAALDPDELELDPELQALIETAAEENTAHIKGRELAGVAAGDAPGTAASGDGATPDPLANPAAEAKAASGDHDMLSMFEENEVEDTRPAALREAIKPCTIEDLVAEAQAMRAILSGNRAA